MRALRCALRVQSDGFVYDANADGIQDKDDVMFQVSSRCHVLEITYCTAKRVVELTFCSLIVWSERKNSGRFLERGFSDVFL